MRTFLTFAAALLLVPVAAEARPTYPAQVPNSGGFGCNLCHSSGGGTPRNPFGLDVEANLAGGTIDWATVSALDSDGDGYTNGEELGDPDGDGTPIDGLSATDPADAGDNGCGNGNVEAVEVCDGDEGITTTCEDEGFTSGTVTCAADCLAVDTSGCGNDVCGDGAIGDTEECDGEDLGDATCADFGFDSGELACSDSCLVDTTGCVNEPGGDDTGVGGADAGSDAGGADAGAAEPDASTNDASTGSDSGGSVDPDDESDGGSGGCSAVGATGPGASLMLLAGLLFGARRRRGV